MNIKLSLSVLIRSGSGYPILIVGVVLNEDAEINGIHHFTELWPLIARKIENGKTLLLLDGWDEVRENKPELRNAIESFAEQSNERRIYLTRPRNGNWSVSLTSR